MFKLLVVWLVFGCKMEVQGFLELYIQVYAIYIYIYIIYEFTYVGQWENYQQGKQMTKLCVHIEGRRENR